MKPTTRLETVEVTADGEGLVSHAGTALLAELADRAGLTKALSHALAPTRERRSAHDPGRVVRDLALTLCDGGDCVSDRSEEHTSELQSRLHLVCRLLLEKKNKPIAIDLILRPDTLSTL